MRTLHALPHSPATQPYNQMKPYDSGGYRDSYHSNHMDMGGAAYGQPVTPTPNYYNASEAPVTVTPPMWFAQNGWVKDSNINPFDTLDPSENIEVDFFGLPIEIPVNGAALVVSPNWASSYNQGDQYVHERQGSITTYSPTSSYTHQPQEVESKESVDDLKSSIDVMREQGAGLRALRLLDETAINQDPYSEPTDDRPRRSLGQAILHKYKKERVKNKKAKQVRKQMILGYNKGTTKTLAESSRTETVESVQMGYDPELIADKCQIDFDRQRGAQLKALNLLNSNLF
jgi:hypothetical protein